MSQGAVPCWWSWSAHFLVACDKCVWENHSGIFLVLSALTPHHLLCVKEEEETVLLLWFSSLCNSYCRVFVGVLALSLITHDSEYL